MYFIPWHVFHQDSETSACGRLITDSFDLPFLLGNIGSNLLYGVYVLQLMILAAFLVARTKNITMGF